MRRLVFFAGWSHAGKEPCRNKLTAPTLSRLSVCRVPTHRDALWCMSGGRPDESGRGRHEWLGHRPPAPTRSSPAFASELRYACLLLVSLTKPGSSSLRMLTAECASHAPVATRRRNDREADFRCGANPQRRNRLSLQPRISPSSANRCSSSTILGSPTLQPLQLDSRNRKKGV